MDTQIQIEEPEVNLQEHQRDVLEDMRLPAVEILTEQNADRDLEDNIASPRFIP